MNAQVQQIQYDASKYTPEVIAEATAQGWMPPDKFTGKGTWLPPDQFVERGTKLNPILRSRVESLTTQLATAQATIQQLEADGREFKKIVRTQADREWQAKFDQLKAELSQAVTDGDGPKAAEVTATIQEHAAAKPAAKDNGASPNPADTAGAAPAWFTEWQAANPWYADPDARVVANSIGAVLSKREGLTGLALANRVAKEMAERHPDLIGASADDPRGATVIQPGRRQPQTQAKARTYENLPADAKAACDRMVARKWGTREEYVANYQWED